MMSRECFLYLGAAVGFGLLVQLVNSRFHLSTLSYQTNNKMVCWWQAAWDLL